MHKQLRTLVTSTTFEHVVLAAIVANAALLGLETYSGVQARWGSVLHMLDVAFIAFFATELLLKVYAYRDRFFTDGWNVFDTAIVILTLVPAVGNVSVLRAVRIFRALRLISLSPSLRRVVTAIAHSVRDFGAVLFLLALISYVYAVLAVHMFGTASPEYFGDVGKAMFTLFQILTLDAWSDIARPLAATHALAPLFFVSYIAITVFMLLSIVVGIAANAIEKEADTR